MAQKLGIKERLRYKDISWLMPSVDVKGVLHRLGVKIDSKSGDEITAYCPDHALFVGREPSHPKWTVNVKTGGTFCFTEGRGSNLIWIVGRLFDCTPSEAAQFLTGSDSALDTFSLDVSLIKQAHKNIYGDEESDEGVKGLDAILKEMENPYMSQKAYEFFMRPPGKKPTDIRRETVNRYKVFERTWGYYTNRVVVPFLMHDELVGFCAIDILGKDEWIKRHPLKDEKDYRKSLYPMNFHRGQCLFGFDDCEVDAEYLIITEGAREVMKLWQEGYKNAVAILGSHLSDNQLMLLSELRPKRLVLMFDGDNAGVQITRSVGIKANQFDIQKCFLPKGCDPKGLTGSDFEKMINKV